MSGRTKWKSSIPHERESEALAIFKGSGRTEMNVPETALEAAKMVILIRRSTQLPRSSSVRVLHRLCLYSSAHSEGVHVFPPNDLIQNEFIRT